MSIKRSQNVFVMKGGNKPSKWIAGDSYITTAQLKLRNCEIIKAQKSVGITNTESLEETYKNFKKHFPKVIIPIIK